MRETHVISFGYDNGAPPKTADRVFDVRDLDYPPKRDQVWQRARKIVDRIDEGDTVAIGCKQGLHRGPAVARAVKCLFGGVDIEHRDIRKAATILGDDVRRKTLLRRLKHSTFIQVRPSKIAGVGVFAVKDIPEGTDPFTNSKAWVELNPEDVNTLDRGVRRLVNTYAVESPDGSLSVPPDFQQMDLVAFLNHSDTPNLVPTNRDGFITRRIVRTGEELTIDYADIEDGTSRH